MGNILNWVSKSFFRIVQKFLKLLYMLCISSAIGKLFLDKKWHFYHPALFFPLTQYRRINNRKIRRILELVYWKIIQRKKKRFFTQISLSILAFFST
jgi:hypothetical protein